MRLTVLLLALGLIAPLADDVARVRCQQGCHRYACKKANFGDKCKAGPNCHGCWKTK